MAATGWNCDIDVCSPGFGSSLHRSSRPMSNECGAATANSTAENSRLSSKLTVSSAEPQSKRSRLTANSAAHGVTNGFAELSSKATIPGDSPAARLGLTPKFRTNFDARFRAALKEKLSTYLTRLDATEESVTAIQKELQELTGRMNHIDTSSEELKKFVTERVSLPTPTSGVGQRRTLSSQAPRLPPPPPLVSAPEPTASTISDSSALTATAPPLLTPSSTNRANMAVCSTVGLPGPTSVSPGPTGPGANSGSVNTPSPSPFRAAAPAVGTQNLLQALGAQHCPKPPLAARLTDTIDLTVETTPPIGSPATASPAVTLAAISEHAKLLNLAAAAAAPPPISTVGGSSVPQRMAVNNNPVFPIGRSQTVPTQPVCSVLTQPVVSSKPAPSFPRAACASQNLAALHSARSQPFADCTQLQSPLDLNPLPVAPLPPIPYQPHRSGRAIQPMPLLTIAEAAEGICLQWTISHQSVMFEPATAYEIYSYASSELTPSNMYTHLPWKKVGEVTALPLPMACTLTHVQANNMYYFTVRSVDRFRRYSNWSNIVNAVVG